MKFSLLFILLILQLGFAGRARAIELLTNAAHFADAPKWVTMSRVNRIADSVQNVLEWDIRRVEVVWYNDEGVFENAHGLGPLVLAVSQKNNNRILIGPRVTDANFDATFGHELVHVISYQKYKEAIPKWLEEGLANYIAKAGKVDYPWLAKHPFPDDVHNLTHPFSGGEDVTRYTYMASQALVEMIAAKCDLRNLLRLSVGMKMDGYFDTYCNMKDMNASYQKWVREKAGKS